VPAKQTVSIETQDPVVISLVMKTKKALMGFQYAQMAGIIVIAAIQVGLLFMPNGTPGLFAWKLSTTLLYLAYQILLVILSRYHLLRIKREIAAVSDTIDE